MTDKPDRYRDVEIRAARGNKLPAKEQGLNLPMITKA